MTKEELCDWCYNQECGKHTLGDCYFCMHNKGRTDLLDEIIKVEKNKYYCDEELCNETKNCSDCMVKYLEGLKR